MMNSCINGSTEEGESHPQPNNGRISQTLTTKTTTNGLQPPDGDTRQGCYVGCFGSSQSTFCETNYSGYKPNVMELAKEEPSCGLWFGCFCRQFKSSSSSSSSLLWSKKKNNNNNKNKPGRSHLYVDGGGWFKTHKQRTTFLVVVQDEVVKGTKHDVPNNNNRKKLGTAKKANRAAATATLPPPGKSLSSASTSTSSTAAGNNIVPKTIRTSISRITSKSNHSTTSSTISS